MREISRLSRFGGSKMADHQHNNAVVTLPLISFLVLH
jgi:hypothetical protein